jgi:hypothetical protein
LSKDAGSTPAGATPKALYLTRFFAINAVSGLIPPTREQLAAIAGYFQQLVG